MTAAPAYGLSVHHFISQVGDYVGFAAIVAVAIMVLLLFAHARETADLRRRAEDAEDELALLHEQVQWLRGAQQSTGGVQQAGAAQASSAPAAAAAAGAAGAATAVPPAAVPAPAAARAVSGGGRSVAAAGVATAAATAGRASGSTVAPVAPPPGAERALPAVPGAPVGVGAPALSSATKLIPPTDEELRAVAAAAARGAGAGSPATESHDVGLSDPVPPVAPPPATVAAGNGSPPGRGAVAPPTSAPGGGGRPGQSSAVVSPRRNYGSTPEGGGGGRRKGRLLAAAAALAVIVIVVLVVVFVLGNNSSSSGHHASAATTRSHTAGGNHKAANGKGKFASVNIDPTTVTVSVLNGTMTTNLAADVSNKLTAKGFQAGSTGNAADQAMQATVVGYVPGVQNAKNDAYAVAHTLGLKETAVKPVSSANQTVACSGETTCPDQVIVTVGADLNSDAT